MNCAVHNQTPAVGYCRNCGKALCEMCRRDVRGVIYCEDCLAARVGLPPAVAVQADPQAQATAHAPVPGAPNPAIAALLAAIIPGVGAMYCGEFLRALIHVAVLAGSITLLAQSQGSHFFRRRRAPSARSF